MQESVSAIAEGPVVLRAMEYFRVNYIAPWNDCGLFYVEFDITDHGRLCRNIVIEDGSVRLVEDTDV